MTHTGWSNEVRRVINDYLILNSQFLDVVQNVLLCLILGQNVSFEIEVLYFRSEFLFEDFKDSN
jgi:hypothetical protein